MNKIIYIFLVILLVSCSSENGNRIVGDKLTVYFDSPKEERIAEKIALYWKDNDLLTGQKQDLKVISAKDGYVLKIITTSPKESFSLPYEELKLLLQLEVDLNEKVADSPLEIVICNNQFEPIYNVD